MYNNNKLDGDREQFGSDNVNLRSDFMDPQPCVLALEYY